MAEPKEKQFSLASIRYLAGTFAKRWKGTTQENANTQLFWAEFFNIFGIDAKRTVLFERHATRLSTGNRGRIDVFWPGELIIEQKSAGKDLNKAAQQAFDYLDDLDDRERPHTLVVSDFESFEVHDLTAFPIRTVRFKLSQLPQRIGLFSWMAGYTRRPAVTGGEEEANRKAVQKMASLYDAISQEVRSEHFTSIFLTRILFLLFAEDTGLIDRGLFAQIVRDRSSKDGSDLGGLLADVFQTLDTDPKERHERTDELLQRLPYVNGSVFTESIPLTHFDQSMREALLGATDFEWGTISPAVFGSMFQSVKSKEARRELGEHYTTERDILRALGPLFLDEVKAELEAARFSAKRLEALWERIAGMRFLDPACGCGNFLVITYRELREIELTIMERLQDLRGDAQSALLDEGAGLRVSLSQMHGIEIEEWPAKIAETALFIVDHQANRRMMEVVGVSPERLPLKTGAKIVRDNALTLDWGSILDATPNTVVVGNPPFIGARNMKPSQRKEMEFVWGDLLTGNLDYVTAWYKKTVDFFGPVPGRWAFVSTNSICQGEPTADLWRPIVDANWRCRFAHRSFGWTSEATGKAAVHVSILGFDRESSPKPSLWTYAPGSRGEGKQLVVSQINPYLSEGPVVFVEARSNRTGPLHAGLPPAILGHRAIDGGGLFLNAEEFAAVQDDAIALKYIRRFLGASELMYDTPRWCLWMLEPNPTDIAKSPFLRGRLERVRAWRLEHGSDARKAASFPYRFGIVAPSSQFDLSENYLAIPRHVGESRPYFFAKYVGPDTVTGDANCIASDPDGYGLGILSSKMFIAWMKAVGGRIKSDPRFSSTFTYNTFPMPSATPEQRAAIVEAAAGIIKAREAHPGVCLADLYNPVGMPIDLIKAHQVVDRAVDKVFNTRASLATLEDRQRILFKSYAKLTGQEAELAKTEMLEAV